MAAADEFLQIDTPENVVFGYEVADIGSRFLAAVIDTTLLAVLLLLTNLTLFFFLALLAGGELTRSAAWLAALFGLISFTFLWGYYIFFELLWNGQSPGKRWLGLRVLRVDGQPIGVSEAVIRNLIRIVDFLPAYYGLGVVTMFLNQQARRLGDLAAGTLVVYDQGNVTLESLETQALPVAPIPQVDARFAHLPFERLAGQEVAAAESFLQRRHQLANADSVATELARRLLQSLGEPAERAPAPAEALALLRAVANHERPGPAG